MNTESSNTVEPLADPSPQPPAPAQTASRSHYRPKGKIASLPKEQRDLINHLLLEGNTYAQVAAKLSEQGVSLNAENLCNWHTGPYQDWLCHEQWREDTRDLQESALELTGDTDPARFNQSALKLASLQIFAALRQLPHGSLDQKLGGDSASFARLVNALSRATREALNAQRYLDACARARAALQELKNPKRKLTQDERRSLILQVDEILGLASDAPDVEPLSTSNTQTQESETVDTDPPLYTPLPPTDPNY